MKCNYLEDDYEETANSYLDDDYLDGSTDSESVEELENELDCEETGANSEPGSKNDTSLLNTLKPKTKGKMYFDEEKVKKLIVEDYQPYLEYGINAKGKRVCISREKASKEVEKEIMGNLLLIANAIINKYGYWRFEPLQDLQAEALSAMWYYLPNFKPGKGTAFNLFSLICKKDLLHYTLKNKRNREAVDIDAYYDISYGKEINYDLFFDSLEKVFLEIIDKHYIKEQRKKYIELTSILMEYLDTNKQVVGKNDLLSAFKSYSYKSTEYKKFIAEISKYKDEIYDIMKL